MFGMVPTTQSKLSPIPFINLWNEWTAVRRMQEELKRHWNGSEATR
jgi:hypothetical protein